MEAGADSQQLTAGGAGALGGMAWQSGDASLLLLPSRAAWWPALGTLLVADLHLGKAETFRAAGAPLPSGTVVEALDRLSTDIAATGAGRVLVLGDLLHAPIGLTPELVDAVAGWRAGLDIELELIPGNHDRKIERVADAWRIGVREPVLEEGGLVLCHDPSDAPLGGDKPVWCGHIHPAVRLGKGGGKRACFALSGGLSLMPAFSLFTGGKPVGPGDWDALGVIAEDRVVRLG